MPRKPSSVFLIAEAPNAATNHAGMRGSSLQAWRLPLHDDESLKDVVKARYAQQPVGTTLYVVEDTKVTAYTVGLRLDEVADARLDDGQ